MRLTFAVAQATWYNIFINLSELNYRVLPLNQYIILKKKYRDDIEILKQLHVSTNLCYDEYKSKRHKLIEDNNYLSLDSLILNDENYKKIIDIGNEIQFYIITLRNNVENYYIQLKKLKLDYFITKSIVLKPQGVNTKLNWIEKNCSDKFWIVGDSEAEMVCGSLKRCNTCFVQTGLRDISMLNQEIKKPSLIYNNINEFVENIEKNID